MADQESVSGIEFVNVRDCWGQDIPIPRPLALQAARSGLPVTVVLNADACTAAIKGVSCPRDAFSELDRHIAAVLDAATERLSGKEVASMVYSEHGHYCLSTGIADRFRSGRPLRRAGYTGGAGGYAAPDLEARIGRKLTDTEQAIVDVLRRVGAPMKGPELAAIDEVGASEAHIRRLLQRGEPLRASGLVKHQSGAGYYIG